MPSYELTPEADSDLEGIARYTIREWGEHEAKVYLDTLTKRFQKIAAKKIVARPFSEKFPQAFVTRCEHHYIFYIHPENGRPLILAVLHERIDFLARLQERLSF